MKINMFDLYYTATILFLFFHKKKYFCCCQNQICSIHTIFKYTANLVLLKMPIKLVTSKLILTVLSVKISNIKFIEKIIRL